MLRRLAEPGLRNAERDLGASLDYLRHMADVAPGAFLKFSLVTPLSRHRKALPPAPYHVARITAVRHEDCGTCVQMEVNLARQAGVAPDVLRVAALGSPEELPEDLREVAVFALAVVTASEDMETLRVRLLERYGAAGLVELALGIATCRVFPATKRALGYATACHLVQIDV
ncbi:MAG: hypothetical protein HKN04_01190 [Rhodothermaceae bacterium]|nr:hypothetical protein [Rhodothermaceae bacterium]